MMRGFARLCGAVVAASLLAGAGSAVASVRVPQTPLPGASIPKYVDALPTFAGARVDKTDITVRMQEFQSRILPDSEYLQLREPFNAGTFVWGYKVDGAPASYPARTIEAHRWIPTTVRYINDLHGSDGGRPFLQRYLTVDQTLHWADPRRLECSLFPYTSRPLACFDPFRGPVPTVVHLHGGEVPSAFDGGPDSWFTPNGLQGPGYSTLYPVPGNQAVYRYPNGQEATTLWFHDHALGTTRINVYAGFAGFYLLRDFLDTGKRDNPLRLPAGAQEIELAIQDRQFDTKGQLIYPDVSDVPFYHPFWRPEFFGDVIVVNGKSWPYLEVEPRRYRLRMLDGSNARFYRLALVDNNGEPGPTFWQIGTDGGLLDRPVAIAAPDRLLMAPGERSDVIVDFSQVPLGTTLTLVNDAPAPFPDGDAPEANTTGQIMQFRVVRPLSSKDRTCNPAGSGEEGCRLRPLMPIVRLANPVTATPAPGVDVAVRRQLVLKEVLTPDGPREILLNNTEWSGYMESSIQAGHPTPVPGSRKLVDNFATEFPRVGSTEEWEIINLTVDAHPIHLHLVQFQILNRQPFLGTYNAVWEAAFPGGTFQPGDGPPRNYNAPNTDGALGGNPAITPYLDGAAVPPEPREAGWKDTVVMPPGQVTRILVRFAPQDWPVSLVKAGLNLYPFDPTLVRNGGACVRDRWGNPAGPGYAWHCHILEHEDNEMMRPYVPRK